MSRRAVVALGLAGVLAWAGATEAAGAWVLWENRIIGGDKTAAGQPVTIAIADWAPREGFEKAAQCLARLEAIPANVLEHYVYRCLPDTVDPRAPKGR